MTSEKKDLIVDSYLKWRISDFSRYYLATGGGDVSQAEVLLKRKFSDRLRSEIGRTDVKDIVTDSRGKLMSDVRDALNTGTVGDGEEVATTEADDAIASAAARVERETTGKQPQVNPNSMAALGIEVIDVRIKQINLPAEVSDAIYQRMRAEREAVARRLRSQGREEAEAACQRGLRSDPYRRKPSVRRVSPAVKAMPKRPSCSPTRSAGIRTSMPLSAACVPMKPASGQPGRVGTEPGQRFLPLHEVA